jgi:hypothetical protein
MHNASAHAARPPILRFLMMLIALITAATGLAALSPARDDADSASAGTSIDSNPNSATATR